MDDDPTVEITGNFTGEVTEDARITTATGTLNVAGDFVIQTTATGTYGTFDLAATGEWIYTLDNDDPDTNALAADARMPDVFTAVSDRDANVTQVVTITVIGANDAPTAVIDGDPMLVVVAGDSVTLNSSGSADPDTGDSIDSYLWSVAIDGVPPLAPDTLNEATLTFTAPQVEIEQPYTIALVVSDGEADSLPATVTVTVIPDTVPDFGAMTIGNLVYTVGESIGTVELPEALNDDGEFSYSINALPQGPLPQGLSFTSGNLSGTPEVVQPSTPYIYTATDSDGDIATITFTITINPNVIRGIIAGAVTERGALNSTQVETATGVLTLQGSDFAPQDGTTATDRAGGLGTYGTFVLATTGAWTYTLDNASMVTNALAEGTTRPDVFTVVSATNAIVSEAVTITITGANDAPEANARVPLSQPLPQDVEVTLDGTDSSDPDTGDTLTYSWAQTDGPSDDVMLADPSAVMTTFRTPIVGVDTTLTFTLTVTDQDGVADTDTVTVTVDADNTASMIEGMLSGSVTEDDAQMNTATGQLMVTDMGVADPTFQVQPLTTGTYGTFELTTEGAATGTWTYTLDNNDPDTNMLAADETAMETFLVQSSDNTPAQVVITITGADDAPTITGTIRGVVTEDATTTTATGTLTVTDPDSDVADDPFVAQILPTDGMYGTFTLTIAGVWTYTLVNERLVTNALYQGIEEFEEFMVEATNTGQATISIRVIGANDAPIANAGADQPDVRDGATVTLDGSLSRDVDRLSDGRRDVLRYEWEQTGGPSEGVRLAIRTPFTSTTTFTAQLRTTAILTFTLTVADEQGATDVDTVDIFIDAVDDPAVIVGMSTGTATEDSDTTTVLGRLTVNDPEGEDTFMAQSGTPDIPGTPGIYGIFRITALGEWTYQLDNASTMTNALAAGTTRTDVFTVETADSTTATVTITVIGANDAPTAEAVVLPSSATQEALMVILSGTGSDVDEGDSLRYRWAQIGGPSEDIMLERANTSTATFIVPEFTEDTDLTFRLTVTDSSEATGTATVGVVVRVGDTPTIIAGVTRATVIEDVNIMATGALIVTDQNDPNLAFLPQEPTAGVYGTFALVVDGANGMWTYMLNNDADATQALGGTAEIVEVFTVRSTNGTEAVVTITVRGTNDVPTIVMASGPQDAVEETVVMLTGVGSDVDEGDILRYRWTQTGGPSEGVRLAAPDSSTGTTTFTAQLLTPATLTFTLTVTDLRGATATAMVVIAIDANNDPATIAGVSTATVTEDSTQTTVFGRLTVNDPDGENIFMAQPDIPGTDGIYGTFSITESGGWTYGLDNASTVTNALEAGEEVTDEFTVESADGTMVTVTITVIGANDAPTAEAAALPSEFTQEGSTVTLSGTGQF